MVDKIAKMRRIASILTEALGREPTDEELAEELGLPRHKVAMLNRPPNGRPRSTRRSTRAKPPNTARSSVTNPHPPLEMLTDKNLHDQIDGLLSVLDERERRIIDERFGLNGLKPMLLEDVGREFGVSRERIRQLQNSALAKMRQALMKKRQAHAHARQPRSRRGIERLAGLILSGRYLARRIGGSI